jgi:glycosyltransferase involved in cell wall biosynthesis
MRIVYVLTSLGMGGAEKLALAIAERMSRRGHSVAILVLKPPVVEEWPTRLDRSYLEMDRSPLSFLSRLAGARRFVSGFRPDVLHSHCFHANILARLLRLSAPHLSVVSTIHNVYEGGWARMLAYRITDCLSRRTIAVSHAAAERFIELKAIPIAKCGVIANGIDPQEFAPNPDRRSCMRVAMGIPNHPEGSDFLWLAIGRVAPAKDYANLLHAFAQVRARRSAARLSIAGDSVAADLAALKSLASGLHVSDDVRWLGVRRDTPDLLDAADGFVLSSAWEGMPLAVAEAMAMEKPVVATDVGGVRELVGDAGLIVPSRNPEALSRAMIATMQQSREERSALGRAARLRIIENFSIDANADRWETLYRELLAERRLPSTE